MSEGGVDPRVQAALQRAEDLADASPEEHVVIYEEVHDTLQQVLADAGGPANEGRPAVAPDQSRLDGDAGT